MPLAEIRNYAKSQIGQSSLRGNEDMLALIDDRINEAAEEVYEQVDIPGCHEECNIQVADNLTIALPQFIGKLRGIREHYFDPNISRTRPWHMQYLMPRYINDNWDKRWTKFTYRGVSPLQRNITNAGVLTFEISNADSSALSVTGSTVDSNVAVDAVNMSATSVNGVKNFSAIQSINKRVVNDYNIVIKDQSGNVMAILYNNTLETKYEVYDVSQYPDISQFLTTDRCLEILYKKPLFRMTEDAHCFPVPGYDLIIAKKVVQNWTMAQPGKEQRALAMDKLIDREMNRKIVDTGSTVRSSFQCTDDSLLNTRDYLNYSWMGLPDRW